MLDWLTDPLAGEIARRGLAELLLLSIVCGPLGVWLVLYRQGYAAESVAHAALPGLVLASLVGFPLLFGAFAGLAAATVAVAIASRAPAIGSDTAVAIVVTTGLGLGALLATSPDVPARLDEVLFGDPLGVSGADLAASGGLVILIGVGLLALRRPLTLTGFDPVAARSLGAATRAADLALLAALATTTLVAVQALGNLLVVALLIAPGAAALRVSDRLSAALTLSIALAAVAGVAGIYTSHYLEIAAGAAVALAAVATYAVAALLSRTSFLEPYGG